MTSDPQSEGTVVLVLLAASACLLVLGVVAKMLDLRLRRDGEAIAVRGLISDALHRDPNLFGTSIAVVRLPFDTTTARDEGGSATFVK